MAGTSLGRFRLDALLGEGSYGAVYEATDLEVGDVLALKVLRPELVHARVMRERFRREMRLARRIIHPGVGRVFDLHHLPEAMFLTMELVRGRTLYDELKAEGPQAPARVQQLLGQLCDALTVAHSAGVIHRDLKPGNIMIRRDGAPVILDFGMATADDVTRLTIPGAPVGSLRYISPEVLEGHDATAASDLYALGVIAYRALEGTMPYRRARDPASLLVAMRDPPAPLGAHVPAGLRSVVEQAMARDPAQRLQSANAMARALAAADLVEPPVSLDSPTRKVPRPRTTSATDEAISMLYEPSAEATLRSDDLGDERVDDIVIDDAFDARHGRVSTMVWSSLGAVTLGFGVVVLLAQ